LPDLRALARAAAAHRRWWAAGWGRAHWADAGTAAARGATPARGGTAPARGGGATQTRGGAAQARRRAVAQARGRGAARGVCAAAAAARRGRAQERRAKPRLRDGWRRADPGAAARATAPAGPRDRVPEDARRAGPEPQAR